MIARRHLITTGVAACCSLIAGRLLSAQSYPQRPIKIVVAGLPGVPFDILARALADKLSASLSSSRLSSRTGRALPAIWAPKLSPDPLRTGTRS
jgi:hypothetical protein